jgi:anaerobic glycerol-3-phosphate dehydrogenase
MLTCEKLIEYLCRFPAETPVAVIVVDTEKRLHHITGGYDLMAELPVVLITTTESEPLDAIAEEATDNEKSTVRSGNSEAAQDQITQLHDSRKEPKKQCLKR